MATRFLIWFWSGGGGGSQFAANLAHRLTLQFGADAVRLSLRADDPTIEGARRRGVHTLSAEIVSDRKRPLTTLASLAGSRRALAEHARDTDVVIVPMNFATAAPLAATLRQPLVYCAHDPEPHPGDYAALAQRATQSVLLQRATKVVALSRYAAGQLTAWCAPEKLVVAPLSSVFEPAVEAPRADGPVRFLFTGRMIAYKGLELLADALDQIGARDDWRLTIAGHGPALTDSIRARFNHPQIDTVRSEWMSEQEMHELFAKADVLLAPYTSATQSGVVSQALAHGKPCVVTPVGALVEQIGGGEAGWVAENADAHSFASAMTVALEGGSRAQKAQGAARMASAAWTEDHWGWLKTVAVR